LGLVDLLKGERVNPMDQKLVNLGNQLICLNENKSSHGKENQLIHWSKNTLNIQQVDLLKLKQENLLKFKKGGLLKHKQVDPLE